MFTSFPGNDPYMPLFVKLNQYAGTTSPQLGLINSCSHEGTAAHTCTGAPAHAWKHSHLRGGSCTGVEARFCRRNHSQNLGR